MVDGDEDKEAFLAAALLATANDFSALILLQREGVLSLIPHNISRHDAIALLQTTLNALDTSECVGGMQ